MREQLAAHSRAAIDTAYKAYYNAAPDQELAEESGAAFAETQLEELISGIGDPHVR